MLLEYTLALAPHHQLNHIESCALEIASYVGDHTHWTQPILPGDETCPEMMFVPERFDHNGNYWICDSSWGKTD